MSRLLEGDLSEGTKSYQYLGDNLNFKKFSNNNFKNSLVYEGTKILFDDGIEIEINDLRNEIKIIQKFLNQKYFF